MIIEVQTNIPYGHEWFSNLITLLDELDYPVTLVYDDTMQKLVNSNNVFFQCHANTPNGRQIVSALNALFRSLLNLSVVLGEYDQ